MATDIPHVHLKDGKLVIDLSYYCAGNDTFEVDPEGCRTLAQRLVDCMAKGWEPDIIGFLFSSDVDFPEENGLTEDEDVRMFVARAVAHAQLLQAAGPQGIRGACLIRDLKSFGDKSGTAWTFEVSFDGKTWMTATSEDPPKLSQDS